MSIIEHIRDTGHRFDLAATTTYLNELKKEKIYKVVSRYPTIHGVDCSVRMDDVGVFHFAIADFNPHSRVAPATFQHDGYGFSRPFLLADQDSILNIPFGVGSVKIKFANRSKGEMFTGDFYEMESKNVKDGHFCRCILTPRSGIETPLNYFQSEGFNVGSSTRVKGLIRFKIKDVDFLLFDYELDNIPRIFIDTTSKCDYELFKSVVDSFIVQYAIVSGELIRERVLFLFAEDEEFSRIKHYSTLKLGQSKKGTEAVKPGNLVDVFPELRGREDRYLSISVLERLIKMSLEDVKFFRACTIVAESHGYPVEIKASNYSVALETLKNIILLENEDRINPIKSKSTSRKLIAELKVVVAGYEDELFNNKAALLQKIEQLNQVSNTDGFLKMFDLLELKLTEADKGVLQKRNDFLHGRIPFEDDRIDLNKNELGKIVIQLHLLLCAVILKKAGYNGYLLNNIRLRFPQNSNEPFYRSFT